MQPTTKKKESKIYRRKRKVKSQRKVVYRIIYIKKIWQEISQDKAGHS